MAIDHRVGTASADGTSRRRPQWTGPRPRWHAVALIAAAAATATVAGGPAPTGSRPVDIALVATATVLVVAAGAIAPWCTGAVTGIAALAVAGRPSTATLAVLAIGLALWSRPGRRWRRTPRDAPQLPGAMAVALSLGVIAHGTLDEPFGLSAAIGVTSGALALGLGARRASRRTRRRAWWAIGLIGIGAVVALGGLALTAARARGDVSVGRHEADAGITALGNGEFFAAAEHFATAADALGRVDDAMRSPWARPAALLPIVAQHRASGDEMAAAATDAAEALAVAVRRIDTSRLVAAGATIDVEGVRALGAPFTDVDAALGRLGAALETARSPWLLGPAAATLDDLAARVAVATDRVALARRAITLAPGLLGADAPARYLVLFTDPAQSRALGGLITNYAELTVTAGHLELSSFGRAADLEDEARRRGITITPPAEFVQQYAQLGYGRAGGGLVGEALLRNLTVSPNFPWVAETAAGFYRDVTGRPVTGVMVMDPTVLATLVPYTDGFDLTTRPVHLDRTNAEEFLLHDQYEAPGSEVPTGVLGPISVNDEVAARTLGDLLGGALPDPLRLTDDLGPLVAGRHLLLWTAHSAERAVLGELGLLGEIPAPDGADGWAVTVDNAAGNRVDPWLQRRASYEAVTDPAAGSTSATLRVELTNGAPTEGLPASDIGNQLGLPAGASRLVVTFYTALDVASVTLDGQPLELVEGTVAGWQLGSTVVVVPSGSASTFELRLAGVRPRPDDVVTWSQPLVLSMRPWD